MRLAHAEPPAHAVAATPLEIVDRAAISPLEARRLLSAAFYDDPLLAQLYGAGRRDAQLQDFFAFLLAKSRLLGERLVGLRRAGALVAVASVEVPEAAPPGPLALCRFGYQCLRLMARMPLRGFILLNRYMRLTSTARPRQPHHYLVFIGVDPAAQGQGLGRVLLEHIHDLVESSASSEGIGLDTENPRNVPLYRRFGYSLEKAQALGPVKVSCMFRPRRQR